jgi:CubicO group peptidase (beta-lactamase class C family)
MTRTNRTTLSAAATAVLVMAATLSTPVALGRQDPTRRIARGATPPARFADPDRARKLAAAIPEIERLFDEWMKREPAPGAVLGLIVDGDLVWVKGAGVRELDGKSPVTADTVFRIASMTKSFTAMAILRLRDEGKLSLDDPVARHVPELATLAYPTDDSPTITIRHLLTHSEGFPEDNPWGDRQLDESDRQLGEWMRAGIPFSTAPGTAFEYSNYGFAILGRVVANVSRKPYDVYVRETVLAPLGMGATTFEPGEIPRDRIALGYRREGERHVAEPHLAHGAFGAMGGLSTSARDLAKYVAFLMSAFPPRDGRESGPILRSSAREMQQAWRLSGPVQALRQSVDGPLELRASSYGYGLNNSQTCRYGTLIQHGGGLPGFGSQMMWLPEHGVGLVGMTNLTYTSPSGVMQQALLALHRTGALEPRVAQASEALLAAQRDVSQLIVRWDDALAARIAADNLFLDRPAARWAETLGGLAKAHGAVRSVGPIKAENALRGQWRIDCERGWLDVWVTLAPTPTPRVQELEVDGVMPPGAEMRRAFDAAVGLLRQWDQGAAEALFVPGFDLAPFRRQAEAAKAWGTCGIGEPLAGDGVEATSMKLTCERGTLRMRLVLDPSSHRVSQVFLVPTRDAPCAP